MAKPIVEIFQPVDESGASHDRLRDAGIDLVLPEGTWADRANIPGSVEANFNPGAVVAAGVSSRSNLLTAKTLDGSPDLRMVVYYTVGYDNVDFDAAIEKGVLIVHSPTESNWGGVAEGVFAYILAMLKKVRERDKWVKDGQWRDPSLMGTYLGARQIDDYPGLTVGIIGLGRIGGRLADLMAPWRMNLIAYDPYIDDSVYVHHNVKKVGLDTLLRESDIVTVHCVLSKETMNFIGAEEIAKMKPTAILANHARGMIVDVDALFDALDKDQIAGAVLDVLPEEPPDPQSPILGLGEKLLISPHMVAGNKGTGLMMAVPWVEKAILDVLGGEIPKHVVNEDVLPLWKERFAGKSLI
ncbi:MAG: NAD(P)-dependent oxidoreductase [Rhodospirillales bacterium]|nr:NAD(P)-dependent oxidoreductase [Rhodospirillales bacterium]